MGQKRLSEGGDGWGRMEESHGPRAERESSCCARGAPRAVEADSEKYGVRGEGL